MPLPGCLLHSGTPFPMSSPICAIVFPWSFSLSICVSFSHHVCVLYFLCLFWGRIIFYIATQFSISFFFYFFVAVNLVSFSMTFSHCPFHLSPPLLVHYSCFSSSLSSLIPHPLSFTFESYCSTRLTIFAWNGIINLILCGTSVVCMAS